MTDVILFRFGAPAFVSYPHFYLADPVYANSIKGVVPNRTEHEAYFIFEPHTGIPLQAKVQLQLNFYIEPIADIG